MVVVVVVAVADLRNLFSAHPAHAAVSRSTGCVRAGLFACLQARSVHDRAQPQPQSHHCEGPDHHELRRVT